MNDRHEQGDRPVLRIVKGDPTPEELAALVAVVASAAATRGPVPGPPHFSLWAQKSRQIRPPQRPGFGAWRASTMPR